MKRLTIWVVGLVTFAGLAVGQNAATMSPYRSMPAPAGASPFGNILFPGGTPSHAMALGASVAGIPFGGIGPGGPPAGGRGGGRARTIVVPYAVPMFTGGWDGGYGGYPPQAQPNVTVVMPQQPAPSVIINHNYAPDSPRPTVTTETADRGGLQVYEATPREPAPAAAPRTGSLVRDDKPTIYLIALKDGSVVQAIGYWAKNGALHYVTPQANIRQVALDTVDRDATERLNADRKLEIDLPLE